MPGHDLIPSVLLLTERNGRDDTAFFYALHERVHVIVQSYLKRVVWKIVDLGKRDVVDFREPVFRSSRVAHKKLIERRFQT